MAGLVQDLPRIHPGTRTAVSEQSFVYVHVELQTNQTPLVVRIWPTTYLIDCGSPHRSTLVHAENISYAPWWTPVPQRAKFCFLLVFTGLPAGCTRFDLVEETNSGEGGAFVVRNIARNETDVYKLFLDF